MYRNARIVLFAFIIFLIESILHVCAINGWLLLTSEIFRLQGGVYLNLKFSFFLLPYLGVYSYFVRTDKKLTLLLCGLMQMAVFLLLSGAGTIITLTIYPFFKAAILMIAFAVLSFLSPLVFYRFFPKKYAADFLFKTNRLSG